MRFTLFLLCSLVVAFEASAQHHRGGGGGGGVPHAGGGGGYGGGGYSAGRVTSVPSVGGRGGGTIYGASPSQNYGGGGVPRPAPYTNGSVNRNTYTNNYGTTPRGGNVSYNNGAGYRDRGSYGNVNMNVRYHNNVAHPRGPVGYYGNYGANRIFYTTPRAYFMWQTPFASYGYQCNNAGMMFIGRNFFHQFTSMQECYTALNDIQYYRDFCDAYSASMFDMSGNMIAQFNSYDDCRYSLPYYY